MKALEFLINEDAINVKAISKEMWPTNKNPQVKMSMKVKGERSWTANDEQKAIEALNNLADRIKSLNE